MNSTYYNYFMNKRLYFAIVVIIVITFLLLGFFFFKEQNVSENSLNNTAESNAVLNRSIANKTLNEENIVVSTSPNSIEPTDTENKLKTLQEDDLIRESRRFEVMRKAPVDPLRNDLVSRMRNESIKETILNLANFDDDMQASSTVLHNDFAAGKIQLVTRLMRVRKLYSIGLKNPELIISDLRNLFQDSLKKWPEAHKKLIEDSDNGVGRSEPASYDYAQSYCLAATYLLAEFGDYDSLPLLSYQYKIHHLLEPPDYSNPFTAPVEPAITFYAMHRLASSYPRDSLSKEAVAALDKYLDVAKDLVPAPKQINVTVWDASYIESDPRLSILNIKDEALQGQKTITMPSYPILFSDGTRIQGDNREKMQKTNDLFKKLDEFVQIVYPPEKNPVP